MEPTSFPEENLVLGKPSDMKIDDCTPLCVKRTMRGEFPIVISCWKLTKEELNEINKTGKVWLTVLGTTMPPVILEGTRPFDL